MKRRDFLKMLGVGAGAAIAATVAPALPDMVEAEETAEDYAEFATVALAAQEHLNALEEMRVSITVANKALYDMSQTELIKSFFDYGAIH